MKTKTCTKCKKGRSLSEFSKHTITKDGLSHWCKECSRKLSRVWSRTPSGMYTTIKSRENFYHRTQLNFSREEFIDWYNKQPRFCVYCDIPEEKTIIWKKMFNHRSTKLSIDRKNGLGDYSIDNITLCCYLCNTLKNNVLTFDEMRYIGQNFLKPKWQSYEG